ncbi:Hypothetical predicted protein [Xyrichtys novacula]|uniref:Uncharacterized protein n=1 Tax=Xyrichtys novacula TaxID=13765 RepID=A0AAV1G2U5_XYRNO|nr:Hypothetical predicted protein [Xyrichtys novacula]
MDSRRRTQSGTPHLEGQQQGQVRDRNQTLLSITTDGRTEGQNTAHHEELLLWITAGFGPVLVSVSGFNSPPLLLPPPSCGSSDTDRRSSNRRTARLSPYQGPRLSSARPRHSVYSTTANKPHKGEENRARERRSRVLGPPSLLLLTEREEEEEEEEEGAFLSPGAPEGCRLWLQRGE